MFPCEAETRTASKLSYGVLYALTITAHGAARPVRPALQMAWLLR